MKINSNLIRFLISFGLLMAGWFAVYEWVLKPGLVFDHYITEQITLAVCWILDVFGYETYYTVAHKLGETYIFIKPFVKPVVRVGASCNGLELLALFSFFIISYPGKTLNKIIFLIAGNTIIHGVNILRNLTLTLATYYNSAYYDFLHRYLLLFVTYALVFYFWLLWSTRFNNYPNQPKRD